MTVPANSKKSKNRLRSLVTEGRALRAASASSANGDVEIRYTSHSTEPSGARTKRTNELLRAAEHECQRLFQSVHDGPIQYLFAARFLVTSFRKREGARSATLPMYADRLMRYLDDAIAQLRDLTRDLCVNPKSGSGLVRALAALANRTEQTFAVKCEVKCRAPISLSATTAAILYRIAREVISNSVRHAQARHICIILSAKANAVEMCVRDDGVGIRRLSSLKSGMGLCLMAHRAKLIGARLTIETSKSQGTKVLCEIPKKTVHPPYEQNFTNDALATIRVRRR